jgi:hypothetical protein
MASFKSYPVFFSLIAAFGLASLGSAWCIYDRSQEAQKSLKVLVKKRAELAALVAIHPGPSASNQEAIKKALADSEVALGRMRAELKGLGSTATELAKSKETYIQVAELKAGERNKLLSAAKLPADPTSMFFNIATFVEKTREKFQTAKIKINPDERFGFASYANAGPARELIPQIYIQREVADYLLGAMIEANPRELISLQREHPSVKEDASAAHKSGENQRAGRASNSGNTNIDLFEIDPRITSRVPGFVDATAFRLTFIGETAALRTLLNKLATFELPLVVRSVEVDPLPTAPTNKNTNQANTLSSIFETTADAPVEPPKQMPLVEKVLSKFTVTVELIDLVETPSTN